MSTVHFTNLLIVAALAFHVAGLVRSPLFIVIVLASTLLVGFVALADQVGFETILGAFAAGALLSLVDRDEAMTHPQLRLKLEAAGFGFFIPIFFITSGLRFDLNALFSSDSTIARVPLFLLALVAVRGVPALFYGRLLARRQQVAHAMPTPATPVLGVECRALCLSAMDAQ